MKQIEFAAAFGQQRKNVQITEPNGAGGPLQIIIDRYYHGIVIKLDGKCVGYLNDKSELTAEDIVIIGERVDEGFPDTGLVTNCKLGCPFVQNTTALFNS